MAPPNAPADWDAGALRSDVSALSVLECSGQAIIGAGSDGRIFFFNNAAGRMFGYSRGEVIGAPVEILLPERMREAHVHHREDDSDGRRCRPMATDRELMARRKDGTDFPVEVSLSSTNSEERIRIVFITDISERKRAESVQLESMRRLDLALQATNSVAWTWDEADGGVDSLLRSMIPFGGDGRGGERAVHPGDLAGLREAAGGIGANGGARFIAVDYRIQGADGEYRWHSCVGRVVRSGEAGEPQAAAGIITDIDDRKRAERERDLFFAMAPGLLCITGADGRFRQVNPAFTQLLGWSEEDLTSEPFIDRFIHPADREASRAAFAELLSSGHLNTVENRYLCKDGGYRWLQWSPSVFDGTGEIYGVARDVTEQRIAEREGRLLGELVQATDAFVALATVGGRVLFLNRAALSLTGLTAIPDGPLEELIPGLGGRPGTWLGEASLRQTVTGEQIAVEVYRFPISMEGDGEDTIGVIARDIRNRKRNEARLHALAAQLLTAQEDERSRIARELHDDFTQRLAALGMELGALRKLPAGSDAGMEAGLRRVQEQVGQLSEDTRLLSHQLHPSMLEYAGLASALQAHCHDVSRQHGIRVHCAVRNVPEGLPREVAVGLYRIAQEALRNTVRHANAPSATVTLAGAKGRVRLTITDGGRGFDSTAGSGGPGIGLASMEERARLIGASLQIESLPGEGTSIAVEVPFPETVNHTQRDTER